MSKKADLSAEFVVGLAVLLIGAVVVIYVMYVLYFSGGGLYSPLGDSMCAIGAAARHSFGISSISIFPEICTTRVGELDATDFSRCENVAAKLDSSDVELFGNNKDLAYSACASEQLIKLARRCWNIRGAGQKDPGDFTCFIAEIAVPGEENPDIKLSRGDLQYFINNLEYDGKPFNETIKSKKIFFEPEDLGLLESGEAYDKCIQDGEVWAVHFGEGSAAGSKIFGISSDRIVFSCVDDCSDDSEVKTRCKVGTTSADKEGVAVRDWWSKLQ